MDNDIDYLIEQAAKPPEQPSQVQPLTIGSEYIDVFWLKPIDNSALITGYLLSIGPHGTYMGHGDPSGTLQWVRNILILL